MHLLFFANMGRDFSFTRNVIAPLNQSMQKIISGGADAPVAQVHNKGCAGAADTACDACLTTSTPASRLHWRHGNVYGQFLFDVPFNTSAGKKTHHIFCHVIFNFILLKLIILQRRARDKHRESTQTKEWRFQHLRSLVSEQRNRSLPTSSPQTLHTLINISEENE